MGSTQIFLLVKIVSHTVVSLVRVVTKDADVSPEQQQDKSPHGDQTLVVVVADDSLVTG